MDILKPAVNEKDLSGFLSKVDDVTEKLERLKRGEEVEEDENEEETPRDLGYKKGELRAKQRRAAKEKEKQRWWEYAEMHHAKQTPTKEEAENRKRVVRKPLEYSVWEKWLENPDDPASKEEEERRAKELEKQRDEEFERLNPDFCSQVGRGWYSYNAQRVDSRYAAVQK